MHCDIQQAFGDAQVISRHPVVCQAKNTPKHNESLALLPIATINGTSSVPLRCSLRPFSRTLDRQDFGFVAH